MNSADIFFRSNELVKLSIKLWFAINKLSLNVADKLYGN